jgi:hypothetical protein
VGTELPLLPDRYHRTEMSDTDGAVLASKPAVPLARSSAGMILIEAELRSPFAGKALGAARERLARS